MNQVTVNVYDLLSRNTLVITKEAIQKLQERVQRSYVGQNATKLIRHKAKVAKEIDESKKQLGIAQ